MIRFATILLLMTALATPVFAADTTATFTDFIEGAPSASTLGMNDLIPIIQNGVTKSITPGQIQPTPSSPTSTYDAKQFGNCTWDATHDVGSCVNTAINTAAQAGGGTVTVPIGIYGLSTKLVWPSQKGAPVRLQCALGTGDIQQNKRGSTRFKWIGAAGGRMAEVKTTTGRLEGHEIHYCEFDGNHGLAADGLHIENSWFGHFDNLTFGGGFNGGNVVNLDVTTTTGGGTQRNTLDHLLIDNLYIDGNETNTYTSNQLRLGSYMDSTQGYMNAAVNWMRNIFILGSSSTTGILCVGCDNNQISGQVVKSGGVGNAVDLTIGRAGNVFYPANGNNFGPWFQYVGTFTARGETSFPGCIAGGSSPPKCTYANQTFLDITNGTPNPVIEPGAYFQTTGSYGTTSGYSAYGNGVQPGFWISSNTDSLSACLSTARANGVNVNLYMCNNAESAFFMTDSLGGDRFFQRMTGPAGAQNYQFFSAAGTGIYEFVPTVQMDNGIQSGLPYIGSLGSASKPFQYLYSSGWLNQNAGHAWGIDLGLTTGSADAPAKINHDGTALVTFGTDFVTRVKYLAADQTTPTGGCVAGMMTSDIAFFYVCTSTNSWKRVALSAF